MWIARVEARLSHVFAAFHGAAALLLGTALLSPAVSEGVEPAAAETFPSALSVDETFWQQPERILAAASTVAPGESGRADVFFIGFAGDASQEVFAREVRYAAQVFGRRIGPPGRSLLLLNNRTANGTGSPIASVGTLRLALEVMAARMDVQQDVLFLYLTSHGLPSRDLYVSNGELPLEHISPARLREVLDEFRFRRKVVVVSACYSGGFADALADDTTAVLTAARADRPSFGCRDSRAITYFGEALWQHAMQRADTLAAAFELARLRVRQMEQEAGLVPSEPQIAVGGEAEKWLGQIRLRADLAGREMVIASDARRFATR